MWHQSLNAKSAGKPCPDIGRRYIHWFAIEITKVIELGDNALVGTIAWARGNQESDIIFEPVKIEPLGQLSQIIHAYQEREAMLRVLFL